MTVTTEKPSYHYQIPATLKRKGKLLELETRVDIIDGNLEPLKAFIELQRKCVPNARFVVFVYLEEEEVEG